VLLPFGGHHAPDPSTRLGGDKLFVDYAGDTVPVIVDPRTGTTRGAHIFVAVMGGSSLSFAHASWTEKLPDWIDAHVQTFAYFGGAARLLVPDNPKVAVIKACFYDPQVNRTYGEMAGKRCKRYDESRSVKLSLGAQLRSNTLHFGQDFRVAGGIDRQPPTQ
jgi:transposase